MRGAFVAGQGAVWESGNAHWSGTIDIEPQAPDTAHTVGGIVSPARTRFRFTGSHGAPTVEAIIEVRQGRPELTSITVTNDGPGGLVTSDLRNISVGTLVENVVMATAERVERVGDAVRHSRTTGDDATAVRNASRRARRAPDALASEIAAAAEIYRASIGGGQPQQAVRDRLDLSERTAARRIQQARAAGLLPPTTKGKAKA